jgi:hypothetical protein
VKRLYSIARVKGGMKFTCSHCAHHVSTLDFDPRDGNLRTQAATSINQHATNVHHEPVMFSSLDAQQHGRAPNLLQLSRFTVKTR